MNTWLKLSSVLLLLAPTACASDSLIIHEWGTLTSLEDENGLPIAGINSDDEPVPSFVHRVAPGLLLSASLRASKGVPCIHPDVTMRLETPVLYVYAPPGIAKPLDVSVNFPGGWLTEFYPDAQAIAPGIDTATLHVGHINAATVGSLHWSGLKIGGNPSGPSTTDRVWLAPRDVKADSITTPAGEAEKFLFYRGVGNQAPILNIVRDAQTETVKAIPADDQDFSAPPILFWLADIRPDGSVAFQLVAPGKSSRPFDVADYNPANIAAFRASLQADIIHAGLYKDESDALLNTWEVSYFKSPGLRAFFIIPQSIVDKLLPLTISQPAAITRVMVGRIELVTPDQRTALAAIAAPSPSQRDAFQLFKDLGRFCDALLLDEQKRRPTAALNQFMQQMAVAYYRP